MHLPWGTGGEIMNQNRMPKIPEKRHYQRLACELPVVLEFEGETVSATADNVSCSGMYLPLHQTELAEDQNVIAFINLPEKSKAVRLPARVRRVEKDIENRLRGIALEFEGLYDSNRLEIDRYVKWKLLN
jgi:c-di-GMP-binding flagellar brake protein YcgR